MPSFIKTPADEARWAKAKKAANKTLSEADGDSYWALTNSIYQKMTKSVDELDQDAVIEEIKNILEKAKRYDQEDEESDEDTNEGMQEFDPENEGQDDADKWLEQNDPEKGNQDEETKSITSETSDKAGPKTKAKTGKEIQKEKELDPERLKNLKDVSGHWLSHADQIRKLNADAKNNPHLFAEGHRIAAHNTAHEGFNAAYHDFINSPEYNKLSSTKKMRAEVQFKKEWQQKNPDFHRKAAEAVSQAHGMHSKAQDAHEREKQARIAHIMGGGQSMGSGDVMSAQEAAQHVGGEKGENGYVSSVVQDPSASFANRNREFLASQKPSAKSVENYEELESPQVKAMKHPALNDPKNKQALNQFFKEYHPLIMMAANKARKQAQAMGIPEDKIDMSAMQEAGMHGLMQAVHDFHPEVGSSFKSHAMGKMMGLMQSHMASQDVVPRDFRSKAKAFDANKIAAPKVEPAQPVPPPAEAPKAEQSSKPKVDLHQVIGASGHPAAADMGDRLKRANAQRSVIVRKKGE